MKKTSGYGIFHTFSSVWVGVGQNEKWFWKYFFVAGAMFGELG